MMRDVEGKESPGKGDSFSSSRRKGPHTRV
jgi:hypothetical protein